MFDKHRKEMVESYMAKSKRARRWLLDSGFHDGALHGTQWVFERSKQVEQKLKELNLKPEKLDEYYILKKAPTLHRLDLAKIREI